MGKMKLTVLKIICLSVFFVFIFIGGECPSPEEQRDLMYISNIGYVYPENVKTGDTVYCYNSGSQGDLFTWSFLSIPNGSTTSIKSNQYTFFVPDLPGSYLIRFTVQGIQERYWSETKTRDFTITAFSNEIKSIAGTDKEVKRNTVITLDGSQSIGEQLTYQWTAFQSPNGANINIENSTSAIATYLVDLAGEYLIQLKVQDVNQATDYDTVKITAMDIATGDPWEAITDYPGVGITLLTGISDGTFGYVGLGSTDLSDVNKDFWKFDPSGNGGSGSWSQLANFPGNDTWDCVSFILNGKIYVGLGASTNPIPSNKKFYVFDPNSNSWDDGNSVAQFPGEARIGASSFVLNGEAYVGLGYKNSFPAQYFDDLYKYNSSSNSWDTLNTFPGGARWTQISFVINNTAYMGYGIQTLSSPYRDFWSYTSDSWTSITPLQPLSPNDFYYSSIGVSTSMNGYLIGGSVQSTDNGKQVWEFNPASGWQRKTSAPEQFLNSNDGFVIGDKIFCGAGNKKWNRYNPSLDN